MIHIRLAAKFLRLYCMGGIRRLLMLYNRYRTSNDSYHVSCRVTAVDFQYLSVKCTNHIACNNHTTCSCGG